MKMVKPSNIFSAWSYKFKHIQFPCFLCQNINYINIIVSDYFYFMVSAYWRVCMSEYLICHFVMLGTRFIKNYVSTTLYSECNLFWMFSKWQFKNFYKLNRNIKRTFSIWVLADMKILILMSFAEICPNKSCPCILTAITLISDLKIK